MQNTTALLASFATLKILNDTKQYRGSFQLLSEFISYVIDFKKLYSFTAIKMKVELLDIFGFDVPEAVVKTSLKSLKALTKKDGIYSVDIALFEPNKVVENNIQVSEINNSSIVNDLITYIKKKENVKDVNEQNVVQSLIAFLVDEQSKSNGNYIDYISQYILENEHNKKLKETLEEIREGSLLYIGLSHNIKEIGSVNKKITLFLGTEILFNLVGYNGEVYRDLSNDFYEQVKRANRNGNKVSLRYFSETKNEVDRFFQSAEAIVEGKMRLSDKPAMIAIVNGCSTGTDVVIKQTDFYHALKSQYGIIIDEKTDYYAKKYDIYNLERKVPEKLEEETCWKFISHINKLRKGKVFEGDIDSGYLMVTNANDILKISRCYTEELRKEKDFLHVNNFAVTIDKITNILWFKMGCGFGKNVYPLNVDIALKARIVLSTTISKKAEKVYNEIKEQFRNGEITREQLAARVITLRNKPTLPEELEGDNIEENLDFSAEYMSRYEEEVFKNKATLKEQKKLIKEIEEKNFEEITKKDSLIQQQVDENHSLKLELEEYKEKERTQQAKKHKRKKILTIIGKLFLRIIIIVAIIVLAVFLSKKFKSDTIMHMGYLIDTTLIVIECCRFLKNAINKK